MNRLQDTFNFRVRSPDALRYTASEIQGSNDNIHTGLADEGLAGRGGGIDLLGGETGNDWLERDVPGDRSTLLDPNDNILSWVYEIEVGIAF